MKTSRTDQKLEELVQTLLIVQLGLADVPQREIREIVGIDIARVNRIVKHLKRSKK